MGTILSRGGYRNVKPYNQMKVFFDQARLDKNNKVAIAQLVYNLQDAGLWQYFITLYPMCGATASAHSLNLVDVSKYKLTFYGGWTHSKTGAKPNGVNAYAETGLAQNASVFLVRENVHMSYYLKSVSLDATTVVGVYDGGNNPNWLFPNNGGASANSVGSKFAGVAGPTVNSGLMVGSSTKPTPGGFGIANGIAYAIPEAASPTMNSPLTFAIGATNFAGGIQIRHTIAECGFTSIGYGFSNMHQLNTFNQIVEQFIDSKTK